MDAEIEEVCKEVLERVVPTPSEKERIQRLADDVRVQVASEVDKTMLGTEVLVGGSVAKDTWLRGEADVDIFMLFPTTLSKQRLGEVGLKVAKEALLSWPTCVWWRERYAEHPYLEAYVNGVWVNIVPCYRVERGKWLSAADRTPFHTDYIKYRLRHKDLRDDIRLFKRFMKGVGVYGAEIRVGGFSGYLCELVVLNYQSFYQSLKVVSEWRIGEVIDVENLYGGRLDEARRFFDAPLIVVDPVDVNRNVAAAVSEERLGELIMASKHFLNEPSLSFFYPGESVSLPVPALREKLMGLGFDLVFVIFWGEEAVPDVLWGQLYKSLRAIKKLLIQNDFNVLKASAWSDERARNVLIFALESSLIPSSKRHIGPPIDSREAVSFLAKHAGVDSTLVGPWIEGDRWMVGVKRKYTNAASLLQDKLKDGGRDAGVAKKFAEGIKGSLKVLVNEEILSLYSSDKAFAVFLSDFLQGKPKWLR